MTTVFLVDDHDLFRAGVRAELPEDLDIIGDASSVEAAIELIRERTPDLVLVDVHMPNGGGRAVITGVHSTHPDILFLAISASDAPEDVVATVRAGARGYVTKTVSPTDLAEAIRRVVDGTIERDPARHLRAPRVYRRQPAIFTRPEIERLLGAGAEERLVDPAAHAGEGVEVLVDVGAHGAGGGVGIAAAPVGSAVAERQARGVGRGEGEA